MKKIEQSLSMSFQEERQSMFDQLLKDREKIFNKNKVQEEVVPQKRVTEKNRKMSIKNLVNEGMGNEMNSVQKPTDFITDSRVAPKIVKRNVNINNVAGGEYEKVKHTYH